MSANGPRDWPAVRSHLRARLPRLLTCVIAGFVLFTGLALSRGATWPRALLVGSLSVAVMVVVIVVFLGGVMLLMVKTRPTDGSGG